MKSKKSKIIRTVIAVVVVVLILIPIFFGKITVDLNLEEKTLSLTATMSPGAELKLEDITEIELRDSLSKGSRSFGIGSMQLSAGNFNNSEFGNYKLYSHSYVSEIIVVKTADEIVCFNLDTADMTKEFYETLEAAISLP